MADLDDFSAFVNHLEYPMYVVTAAASHGGGWLPLTFHQVCDQAASDYSSCMSSWSAVDDQIMGQFMDWLQNTGQPGGAPGGVSVQTMRWAMNAPDTTAPSTSALCDGSPCQSSCCPSAVFSESSCAPCGSMLADRAAVLSSTGG